MLNVNFTLNKNPTYQSIQLYYQPYEVTWALPALRQIWVSCLVFKEFLLIWSLTQYNPHENYPQIFRFSYFWIEYFGGMTNSKRKKYMLAVFAWDADQGLISHIRSTYLWNICPGSFNFFFNGIWSLHPLPW